VNDIFAKLQISAEPVLLAPLAGVSDHPFRRICSRYGADLCYVEMISATALLFESRRTLAMLKRHESEDKLGVQITGKTADETAKAIEILGKMNFETIDINMGCPVTKVVKTGCGSAILRDPDRVYETVRLARMATDKPVTVKIRIGWDRESVNASEVADAAARAGAAWVCIHGRTRADDYSVPVDLDAIGAVKRALPQLPIIGNGNLFSKADADYMRQRTRIDGVMVSRGALGDPWIFARMKGRTEALGVAEWADGVRSHLLWQAEEYGTQPGGFICMRKHLLWYLKGWSGMRPWKEQVNAMESIDQGLRILDGVVADISSQGATLRQDSEVSQDQRFSWDPKWEMDRSLDRGVGADGLC
jgi:tRNA-dihydrouridine synthase B